MCISGKQLSVGWYHGCIAFVPSGAGAFLLYKGEIMMDYGKTLHLPETEFPMRGNLPNKEPEILKFWEEQEIYKKKIGVKKGM